MSSIMDNQSWSKLVAQNRKKCEKILSVSNDIRYAGVFNEFGRTISGKIRPGVKPIFSPDVVRQEFFAIASMMRLREKSSKVLGRVEFVSISHKKINIVLFYTKGMTYYITFNKTLELSLEEIKKIIIQV